MVIQMLQWILVQIYRISKMKITDAKYMKNENGDNASIFFTMDGKQYSVLEIDPYLKRRRE